MNEEYQKSSNYCVIFKCKILMTSAAFHCSLGSQWVAGIDSFWLPSYPWCIHGNGWQICRNNRKVFKIWLCSTIAKIIAPEDVNFNGGIQGTFHQFASFPYNSCKQSKEQGGDTAAPPWHAARPGEEEISNCSVARHCSMRQEVKITMPNWSHRLNGIIWCGIWPRQCTSHPCSLQKALLMVFFADPSSNVRKEKQVLNQQKLQMCNWVALIT